VTEAEHTAKLDELDWLLNDPEAPLDTARIWSLLADIATHTAMFPGSEGITDPERVSTP